jgi:hypothetical protein
MTCFTLEAQKRVDPPDPYSKTYISELDIFFKKSMDEKFIQADLSATEFLPGLL